MKNNSANSKQMRSKKNKQKNSASTSSSTSSSSISTSKAKHITNSSSTHNQNNYEKENISQHINNTNLEEIKQLEMKYISKWNVEATVEWLKHIGYEDCGVHFREHRINGRALLMLSEDDLKEIIKHNVGQRKNLYHLVRLLQIKYNRYMNKIKSNSFFSNDDDEDEDEGEECDDAQIHSNESIKLDSNGFIHHNGISGSNKTNGEINYDSQSTNTKKATLPTSSSMHLLNDSSTYTNRQSSPKTVSNILKNKSDNLSREDLDDHHMLNFCENCLKKFDDSPYSNYSNIDTNVPIRSYKGEKRKTLVSMVYLFLTCLWTSFVLTVVHDRVPDMQKYPPLPDIILDNVPLIPWAFFATEIIGLVLGLVCVIMLIFHKYRTIIFRRMCSLAGTIFFLRSITMLITSLSVPGIHIQCSSQKYGNFMNKLNGAMNILSGVGLYVNGLRTCGDYMFSGHTVWLTLMTHFITEYTPNSLNFLHTFVWILNIFGLFFILGAHEHYSIDVFVAFYITSRLFLYYHSLANNKVLFQRDHKRVKIWFPMLSYFESNIHSIVPNQYEFPPSFVTYFYRSIRNKFKQMKKLFAFSTNGNCIKYQNSNSKTKLN